ATAVEAVTTKSEDASQAVVQMKQKINRLADEAAAHQARRLVALEPHRLPNYRIETDVLQNLKRIFYFAKRMARAAIPAMELREDD
ncbi:MAG: Na/Pi cotransporter family protein, partial [Acidobacteriota bacterium]|nr:Na/Pi cotransporter family protein [Acidobacteriota bacterium]